MTARIAPASPPYASSVADDLARLMPPGMEPIALFRTLAKNPRVLRSVRRGGLLDRGSISLRQRELVILRTTALAGAEYEWGIHAAVFGAAAGFDAAQLYATVWEGREAACWSRDESILVATCDELHDAASLSERDWLALRAVLGEDQILEVLALAGFYRAISCVVNVTAVELENGAPRFPPRRPDRA